MYKTEPITKWERTETWDIFGDDDAVVTFDEFGDMCLATRVTRDATGAVKVFGFVARFENGVFQGRPYGQAPAPLQLSHEVKSGLLDTILPNNNRYGAIL